MEQKVKCSFDPKTYANQPIGMFHCPECGEMVLAGIDHPDYDNLEENYQKYLDDKFHQMMEYISEHVKHGFMDFKKLVRETPNLSGTLLEIWLHADMNEEYNCVNCNRPIPNRLLYCNPVCEYAVEKGNVLTDQPESKL